MWHLQHFRFITKPYITNEEVIADLRECIKQYKKSMDVFRLLFSSTKDAIDNSKKLEEYHNSNDNLSIDKRCPSSKVYKLIETLTEDTKR